MPGARNSKEDLNRIKRIKGLSENIGGIADELGASVEEAGAGEPAIFIVKADSLTYYSEPALGISTPVLALKSIGNEGEGDWLLDVLGVPFGSPVSRDTDSQWFDATTKFYLDRYPTPPPVYYHGFNEQNQPDGEPEFLGHTQGHRVANEGIWFRVALDRSAPRASKVWEAAKAGTARASSGSIAHLARVAPSGHIRVWPIAELSIFDTAQKRQPANRYAVAKPAKYDAGFTGIDPFPLTELEQELDATGEQQSADKAAGEVAATKSVQVQGDSTMSPEEIQALVAQSVGSALAERKAQEEAAAAQAAQVQAQIETALKAQSDALSKEYEAKLAAASADRRLPGATGDAPYARKFQDLDKYDDTSAMDLAVLAGILNAAKSSGRGSGPSEKLRQALAIRLLDSEEGKQGWNSVKSMMNGMGMPMKADELNRSTLSSYGDEWVSVAYSAQLWDKIRLATPVVANIPTLTVPQGAESVVIPLNGTSPTFYTVAQTTAQDANPGRVTPKIVTSKRGTGSQTLTVAKLGAAVNFTGELEEDSLIPWAAELRADLIAESAEVIEHIVIDGDTATGATTNINCIGGTPTGNEAYLLLNGFRKLALVTNTANSRSATTLDVGDYLETVKLMGLGGRNAYDKSKIGILVDMHTHWKTLELAEVKTRDVFSQPTIENGMLTSIYGFPVTATPNMHRANQNATYGLKANTSGKVDLDTVGNNTTGAILAVRWDQWRFGYKRRMQMEIDRDPLSDSTLIVVTMRVGMVYRDNEASAISYNVALA